MAKGNIIKMKRKPNAWETIFANDNLIKGFVSKIFKATPLKEDKQPS